MAATFNVYHAPLLSGGIGSGAAKWVGRFQPLGRRPRAEAARLWPSGSDLVDVVVDETTESVLLAQWIREGDSGFPADAYDGLTWAIKEECLSDPKKARESLLVLADLAESVGRLDEMAKLTREVCAIADEMDRATGTIHWGAYRDKIRRRLGTMYQ